MSNTSATGGYLRPSTSPAPLEGQALLDFFQVLFVGITNLDPTNVRPRWQREPGNLPLETIDWLAFGITARHSDANISEVPGPSGSNYTTVYRNETLSFLISFYGPNADLTAQTLREGLQITQNLEILNLANMAFVSSGDVVTAPELVKDKWYYRVDLTVQIKRQIVAQYNILNLVNSAAAINTASSITGIAT